MRMLTRAILVVSLTIFAAAPASSQELALRTFFDGRVTMLIPVAFEPMSEEMLSVKYPSDRRPTLVFTNPSGSVNVAINYTRNRALNEQIPEVHEVVEKGLRRQFPTSQWYSSESGQKAGEHYFRLDLVTPAVDTDIRNIMLGISLDNRVLLISFNCTRETEAQWVSLGQQIIDSVLVEEH